MAILPLLTLVLLIAVTEREVKKKYAAFGRMPAKAAALGAVAAHSCTDTDSAVTSRPPVYDL